MLKKIFLKILAVIFINFIMISAAQASIETVTGSGEYIMSMKETPEFAQQNAKLYAERAAIEQAGIFISSSSVLKNSDELHDEIISFAAGLLKNITVAKIEMIPLTGEAAGYIKVIVIVEAQIDSADFETALKEWKKREGNARANLVEQNNALQNLVDEQAKRIKELEQNLANIKTAQDKQNVRIEIENLDKKALEALYIQKLAEGWELYEKKDFNESILSFTQAIKLNPNDYEGYVGRQTVCEELKNYEQLIKDSIKIIELNPNIFDYLWVCGSYRILSICYDELQDYERAIKDYSRLIELNLKSTYDTEPYFKRAYCYDKLKKYDKALEDYSKVIEMYPEDEYCYRVRGEYFLKLKKYEEAVKDFSKALEFRPEDMWNTYCNRGFAYAELQQYDKALADYTRAVELNPYVVAPAAWYERGMFYKKYLKNYSAAVADFTKAIEKQTSYANAYQRRGECYQALGETKKANADFAKAKKLGYTE